jgi:hypothetical protein
MTPGQSGARVFDRRRGRPAGAAARRCGPPSSAAAPQARGRSPSTRPLPVTPSPLRPSIHCRPPTCTTTATSHSENGLLRGCSMSGLRKLRHLRCGREGAGGQPRRWVSGGSGGARSRARASGRSGARCAARRAAQLRPPRPARRARPAWAPRRAPRPRARAPVAAALAAAPGDLARDERPRAVAMRLDRRAQQVVLLRGAFGSRLGPAAGRTASGRAPRGQGTAQKLRARPPSRWPRVTAPAPARSKPSATSTGSASPWGSAA